MSRLPLFKRIAALAVLILAGTGLAQPAAATTKVRIEYVRLLRGGEDRTPAAQVLALVVAPGQAVSADATSVQSSAAPAFPADRAFSGGVYARITAVQGAAIVVVDANPVASETNGVRVALGQDPIYLPISSGQKVAVIESVDAPPASGGGGSGGGGDASAVNQVTTNNRLGDLIANPAQYSLADRLKTINTTLGTPMQAGGSIGNTAFGISGTLPAFASTPTVNLGTIGGSATSALQSTGNSSLGSIDTKLSSQATAANQTTGNSSLGSIDTKLSSQATAANQTTGNSSLASILAKQKGALTYAMAAGSPFTLTSSWVKVATTTAATKGLVISPVAAAANFDIEWTSVAAGAAAPADLYGVPVGYGETFPDGLPVGDVYLKSATGMVATVRVGS